MRQPAANPLVASPSSERIETVAIQRDVRAGVSLGTQAAKRGHVVDVRRQDKRFRLVCACGWKTPLNVTRKRAFEMVAQHAFEAAHGQIPEFTARRVSETTQDQAARNSGIG
jgi:copper homeostasis protein CutC